MSDGRFLGRLRGLRRRIRLLLVVDGVAWTLSAGLVGLMAAATIDYLAWLPPAVRLAAALAFCTAMALTIWLRVVRPLTARIGLGEIASVLDLRFEGLEDRLASAVAFANVPAGTSAAMIGRVRQEAAEAAARLPFDSVVRWRRPILQTVSAAVVCAGAGGIAVAAPWFVATGWQRYAHPFGPAAWPRRVLIEPTTGSATCPAGGRFEARARIVRGQTDSLRVIIHTENREGRRQRHVMTFDGKANAYFHRFEDLHQGFVYWFSSGDDSTDDRGGRFDVRVVPRPSVVEAVLTVTDPPYATGATPREVLLQDASASAVVGGRARLSIVTSKPLHGGKTATAGATLALPGGTRAPMERADESAQRFAASFDAVRSGPMAVHLVDEYGFDNRGGTSYTLAVRQDEPPHVVIVEPQAVTEATPAATLGVVISADDDFGLSGVGAEAAVDRIRSDRPSTFDLTDRIVRRREGDRQTASVAWSWDLTPMSLKPGDVVTYRATASDNYELAGRRHPPVRSAEMRVKVISADQLADRIREEVMLLKVELRRLLSGQETAYEEVGTARGEIDASTGLSDPAQEAVAQLSGRQTRLAGRARFLGKRFGKLVDRLDANRSDDRDVRQQSQDASRRLASLSAGAMASASDRLRQASEATGPADQRQAVDRAHRDQKQSVDEIRSLLAGMDRWGDFQDVVRNVQQLLDQQERETSATQRLGRETLGRRPEDLDARTSAALNQRARQQRRLGEDLASLMANMKRLADALRDGDGDAAAAGALDAARQIAETRQLARALSESAEAIGANRISQAQTAQRASEDSLREMLTALEGRQTQELAELNKRLAGAVEKLATLIEDQKTLKADTERFGAEKGDAAQRDALARRQQGLSRAADAVAGQVARADGAATAARGIRLSVGRMRRAAGHLGQDKPDRAVAEQSEVLRQLAESLETLEKLRTKAEAEMAAKTLGAIADEMSTIRDRQAALNEKLGALAETRSKGRSLSRVELLRLDKMGDVQRDLAGALEQLRVRIQTAQVYDWVMRRVGGDMTSLAGRFDRRLVDAASTRQAERILERLGQLLAGLEQERPEDAPKRDPFAEGVGGGSGSGSGTKAKPVPTVAELAVLKALQAELNRRTQRADLKAQLSETVGEEQLEELRQLGVQQKEIRDLATRMLRSVRR